MWVPCHHYMARLQVVDGGDGLQIWRVALNILNGQSRTADKAWSNLGVERGANISPLKEQLSTKCYTRLLLTLSCSRMTPACDVTNLDTLRYGQTGFFSFFVAHTHELVPLRWRHLPRFLLHRRYVRHFRRRR
jgi:hypothetical protein